MVLRTGSVTQSITLTGTAAEPNFTLSYAFADGNLHAISPGTLISFPAVDLNSTATATITISNQGTGSGTLNNVVLSGTGFQLSGLPLLPATVPPGQAIRVGVYVYTHTGWLFPATFRIDLTGRTITGSLAGSSAPPNLSLAYVDPETNNVIALANGGTLKFPDTAVGAATTVTVQVPNTGTGTGSISSIAPGSEFGSSVSTGQSPFFAAVGTACATVPLRHSLQRTAAADVLHDAIRESERTGGDRERSGECNRPAIHVHLRSGLLCRYRRRTRHP